MGWQAKVFTLFPQVFPGPLDASLLGRARQEGIWSVETVDIRRFGHGKHGMIDDSPAGGGAGMVMRPDVLAAALDFAHEEYFSPAPTTQSPTEKTHAPNARTPPWPVIYLSPRGKPFTQERAQALASGSGVSMICGRYEGIDERILQERAIEEVSLGDFVLMGGEIAAMALIEATVRLLPGVIGNTEATHEESFSEGLLEYPHYTRPRVWQGREIPPVLLCGHHKQIAQWRRAQAEQLTQRRRPDLWHAYQTRKGHRNAE